MLKQDYLKELNIQSKVLKKGDKGEDVKRVQEWLNIWKMNHSDFNIRVGIDSDFGKITDNAVRAFQEYKKLVIDGIVGNNTWRALTSTMKQAFTKQVKTNLSDYIVAYAKAHLYAGAKEIVPNKGPWVRAYMNGNDGADQLWCMGFVQTILDQAYSSMGKKYTNFIPSTVGCDDVGNYGKEKNTLIKNKDITDTLQQIKPGDILLIYKDEVVFWNHTGIVVEVYKDSIIAIEGNTDSNYSRNGVEVGEKERNILNTNIDIVKIIS